MIFSVEITDRGVKEIWKKAGILKCFVVSRNSLTKKRIEIIQNGNNTNFVYCLFNSKQAKDIKRDFYIGKTTDLISREIDHKRKKKWWDTIILFTDDKKRFEESDIGAVERILFEKYKACELYNLKNSQHPKSSIDNYHNDFAEYIISILDFEGYGIEKDEDVVLSEETIEEAGALSEKIDETIKNVHKLIISDPKSRYITYLLDNSKNKKYLCTVKPLSSGKTFEVDFFTSVDALSHKYDFLIKVSHMHNRECRMRISSNDDLKALEAVLKDMMGEDSSSIEFTPRKRVEQFRFSMIGLKPGDELTFRDDDSIVCIVCDDRHVEYKGSKFSLSALAELLAETKHTPQGTIYFKYKGKLLDDIRKEKYGK
jgi:hypothetical protein